MITRLARRLGFEASVPVSVVDDWIMPTNDATVPLAPRGGTATCLIDKVGRIQPAHARWTLDWSLAAGARWVSAIESERVRQKLVGPATLETTITTPSGPVVQRVAAAVVDGQPAAIVEIENQGGVAIAVGLVARPLIHGGRGFLASAAAPAGALDLGEDGAVRFDAAASTAVSDSVDLLQHMPAADAGIAGDRIRSRSGGAQAAAVFPLPHTATLRFVVELGETVRPEAAVPTVDDIERGWQVHLDAGARFDVGESDVRERTAVAARGLLTSWPTLGAVPAVMTAMAESGFGADVPRLLADLDRLDDDPTLLAAIARWSQLSDSTSQLDALDRAIGPVARAAHDAGNRQGFSGPDWLPGALGALANRLDLIEQPDVAERVRSLTPTVAALPEIDELLAGKNSIDGLADPAIGAQLMLGVRSRLLADRPGHLDLLPALPVAWRGRTVDVLGVPIEGGTVSFGVRWHGPRPAVLWQVEHDDAIRVTASSIDPDFDSTEASGETLLADPGWPRTS
jgi:hypothetical protein